MILCYSYPIPFTMLTMPSRVLVLLSFNIDTILPRSQELPKTKLKKINHLELPSSNGACLIDVKGCMVDMIVSVLS